jgi:SAM-dependent methyltransferase
MQKQNFNVMIVLLRKLITRIRRSYLIRIWEKNLRFSRQQFVSLGDTNSSFYRPGWKTVDLIDADYLVDLRREPLPFENDTLDGVHLSHLIEHISEEAGATIFKEIYRCLKPGGYCRLSTPDMDLLLDRYQLGDWRFFLQANGIPILKRIIKGDLSPESLLIHNRLLGWFASYSARLDTAGGPTVERQLMEEKLKSLSKYEFRDWCVSLLEANRVYAHIHLYNYQELHTALEKAGFQNIRRVAYGESTCQAMLNPPIDVSRHQTYSLYVEAIK